MEMKQANPLLFAYLTIRADIAQKVFLLTSAPGMQAPKHLDHIHTLWQCCMQASSAVHQLMLRHMPLQVITFLFALLVQLLRRKRSEDATAQTA